MRQLSPIRSHSPLTRPKIIFNYQASPLRERPLQTNQPIQTNQPFLTQLPNQPPTVLQSPKPLSLQQMKNQPKQAQMPLQKEGKCMCGKQSTYKAVRDSKEFCSFCAIGQMKRGIQMNRIQLKEQKFYKEYQQKIDKENRPERNGVESIYEKERESIKNVRQNEIKSEKEREKQLTQLLQEAAKAQEGMDNLCEQLESVELTQQGVRALYRQKKMVLKQHYERIKAAIKLSIEKDLIELDRRQEQSIHCIHQVKVQLDSDLYSLSTLRQEFTPQIHAGMLQLPEQEYRNRYQQWKAGIAQAHSQKQRAAHLVEQLNKHSGNDEPTGELELYDPYTYTLIDSRQRKGETLFSFEKKSD